MRTMASCPATSHVPIGSAAWARLVARGMNTSAKAVVFSVIPGTVRAVRRSAAMNEGDALNGYSISHGAERHLAPQLYSKADEAIVRACFCTAWAILSDSAG